MKKFLLRIVGKKSEIVKYSDPKSFAREQFTQLLRKGLKFPVSTYHL
jgi:hypothetical protein